MAKFRDGRVLFVGDAAHRVSPFGARGANSGIQDTDNLVWKLALVLKGLATGSLLDTYASEREYAADENILNSTRSTDFITPKSEVSRTFRDAVLTLAREHEFARRLVNSGRLSLPSTYADSPLNTADVDAFAAGPVPGAPAMDAPFGDGWLLRQLGGDFTLLVFDGAPVDVHLRTPVPVRVESVPEQKLLAWERYDARPGTAYLLRPDQHVCARWRAIDTARIEAAVSRATGYFEGHP